MKFIVGYANEEETLSVWAPTADRFTSATPDYLLRKGHTLELDDFDNCSVPVWAHGHEEVTWTGHPGQVRGVLVFKLPTYDGSPLWTTNFRQYRNEMPMFCWPDGVQYITKELVKTKNYWQEMWDYHNLTPQEFIRKQVIKSLKTKRVFLHFSLLSPHRWDTWDCPPKEELLERMKVTEELLFRLRLH